MKIKIVNLPTTSSKEDERLLESFVQFNKEWITRYFRLEPSDLHYLSHPKEYILDKGGHVFVALNGDAPIGCCALIPHAESGHWELAKMAVTAAAQGHGAGEALARAAIGKARELGVDELFLEANTKLAASVHLYEKMGFRPVADYTPAYERCNLFMICKLKRNTPS